MKQLTFILFIFLSTHSVLVNSKNIIPQFDERTELISIICRLADFSEYNRNIGQKEYLNEIDSYFSNYKNHDAVQSAKTLHEEYKISYNAWMALAVSLEINSGKISLSNQLSENSLETADRRWAQVFPTLFIEKLNDFYRETEFSLFFSSQKEQFTIYEKQFEDVLHTVDLSWFEHFFGKRIDKFNTTLSLINASYNYASRTFDKDGTQTIFAIMGLLVDENNRITRLDETLLTVIHEFAHSYCNPLIREHFDKLQNSGTVIFPKVKGLKAMHAYNNWQTVLQEAFVRASVIMYLQQDNTINISVESQISEEKEKGYFWMDSLVELLNQYEKNRNQFKNFNDFMPYMVNYYDKLSAELSKQVASTEKDTEQKNHPQVIYSSIEKGSVLGSGRQEWIIKFNIPMNTNSVGINPGKGGIKSIPELEKAKWIDDYTLKIDFICEPDRFYSLSFYNPSMVSAEGVVYEGVYEIDFTTTP